MSHLDAQRLKERIQYLKSQQASRERSLRSRPNPREQREYDICADEIFKLEMKLYAQKSQPTGVFADAGVTR